MAFLQIFACNNTIIKSSNGVVQVTLPFWMSDNLVSHLSIPGLPSEAIRANITSIEDRIPMIIMYQFIKWSNLL